VASAVVRSISGLLVRLYLLMACGSGRRESVRTRWSHEDYNQLQPNAPDLIVPALFLVMLQGKNCGAREAELQGASSVHAGGAMAALSANLLRRAEETAQDDT
jgi:hypothetical protein